MLEQYTQQEIKILDVATPTESIGKQNWSDANSGADQKFKSLKINSRYDSNSEKFLAAIICINITLILQICRNSATVAKLCL